MQRQDLRHALTRKLLQKANKQKWKESSSLKTFIFHFDGKEYTVFDSLTVGEISIIIRMTKEREKNLNPFNARSVRGYFEDTDNLVAEILRRCFRMTDSQIAAIDQMERRRLGYALIGFLVAANNLKL